MEDIGKRAYALLITVIVLAVLVGAVTAAFGVYLVNVKAPGSSTFEVRGIRFSSESAGATVIALALLAVAWILKITLDSFDKVVGRRPSSGIEDGISGLYTWDDMDLGLEQILTAMEKKPAFKPDTVVGLGRSGGVIGGILASRLGSLPFAVLDLKYDQPENELEVEFPTQNFSLPEGAKKVLVVEGATTGGKTLAKAREFFEEGFPGAEFRFAVLIQTSTSQFTCDYYAFLEEGAIKSLPWHGRLSETYLHPSQPENHMPIRRP